MEAPQPIGRPPDDVIFAIERPHRSLLIYYTLCCVPLIPLLPVAILVWVVNYFRYHTMHYKFGAEGVSMSWGILFRRQVLLNYARIQDIHLVSNFIERWLGLARIQVQTASGSAGAEMTIEGLLEFNAVRDFLYARMRGTRDPAPSVETGRTQAVLGADEVGNAALADVLTEIAGELKSIRQALERRKS
jgi:putative membrane protein